MEGQKVDTVLTGVKEESEKIEKSVGAKDQFSRAAEESCKLEVDILCAQIYYYKHAQEMSPVRHCMCMHWKLCVNETLLWSITVTSAMGGLVSDGSLTYFKVAGA